MKSDNKSTPWSISSTEWGRYPQWKKEQLKQDRKTGLNRYYSIIHSESESSNLIFRFDFTKPLLLANTPADWNLPEPYKFDSLHDIEKVIYTVGQSYPLFKFINKEAQLPYNDFKYKNWKSFTNIAIQMEITLVKNESSLNENNSSEFKLTLPTVSEPYSSFIISDYLKGLSTNSATYFQGIYFPLMLAMGFADEQTYEVHNKKFDETYNHAWDFLTVAVKYTRDTK